MNQKRLAIFALLLLTFFCLPVSSEAKITRYLTGSSADARPALFGPVHNLGGGGADVDSAIQWMIDEARGCTNCSAKVDVVILRASGSNGYNAYIFAMNGVDSVESIVLTARRDSSNSSVNTTIRNAEVVFFAGGDQCDYVTNFKGTPVETAVESVYSRGGAVGGTSAGNAIQSEFVYDACGGSVTSSEALVNPYRSSVTFTTNFFNWLDLDDTVTDTHFAQRDRMGRLMTFLVRQIKDGNASSVLGIGVNEGTSVVIDNDGYARVMGNDFAYFVLANHQPEISQPNTPLTYSNFRIWRLSSGQTFDLRSIPTSGYYEISVSNGTLNANPY